MSLSVPNMNCAGCVAKVEQTLKSVNYVKDARVNLAEKSHRSGWSPWCCDIVAGSGSYWLAGVVNR
ncbi:heavy-metal-associated domain-containing protein [Endozoicomonas lisbonensis]|uniref:heavy-metal-associated domain-containing protein n=1 Tax=Endozoicomonas lisbonensis TaxID=3120522 RepID=UPI0033992EFB